jgi:iron complex outermembrane recepter protein
MKFRLLLFLGMLNNTALLAQSGQIQGTIRSVDGQSAEFVNVMLRETEQGTITNTRGEFVFDKLKSGTYTVVASFVGLTTKSETVVLGEDEKKTVNFTLQENSRQLQEVIVFANTNKYKADFTSKSLRLMSPILETPQNIQVIGKQIIADQQAFDMLEGIQRNVSGVQKLEHWDNYAYLNMRGSQITAFRNGMNVQMPWGPLAEDMSMVERIEFVKGPAGFMLANGEPSGFYNVVTKKPSGITKGEASFSLGSFDTYRTTLDLDGKLSKDGKLLYRLNVMGQLKGSHRDYEYNNRYSVVPVLKYQIDNKSSLTLEYTHQFSEMSVIGSNYAFSNNGYADLPRNFTTAEPNLDPTIIHDQSVLGIFEHFFNEKWKLTAQMAYFNYDQVGQSLWPWGISSVDNQSMQRGIGVWDALGMNKTGQIFLNGSAQTGGITHNLLGGIDMAKKDYFADFSQGAALGDSTFNIYNPVYGTIPVTEIPTWDRSRSIRERGVNYNSSYSSFYVQDELKFWQDKLRLTLAGRYTSLKDINPYSGSTDDGKFTPRAGLSYSINKQSAAYFVYDQAFVANPGSDWQGKSFDPITGNNLELGYKKDWMGGRWNSTVAAYRITKNNVLTTDVDHPNPVTGQLVYSRQTGQQQVEGVEVDIKGELLPHLDLILNYAYTDAKVTKDSDESVVGNQVPGATKHIQNAWLSYTLPKSALKGLKFSMGYQYQAGRSSWYIFDNSESSLPNYFRLDGGVSYQSGAFGVTLNVNNLLDKYLYSGSPYGGMYYWQTEAGRNARMTVNYRF